MLILVIYTYILYLYSSTAKFQFILNVEFKFSKLNRCGSWKKSYNVGN